MFLISPSTKASNSGEGKHSLMSHLIRHLNILINLKPMFKMLETFSGQIRWPRNLELGRKIAHIKLMLFSTTFLLLLLLRLLCLSVMGSRAKGKKGEEQDFETFVRESLGSLRDDMRTIMRAQEQLVEELSSLKRKSTLMP